MVGSFRKGVETITTPLNAPPSATRRNTGSARERPADRPRWPVAVPAAGVGGYVAGGPARRSWWPVGVVSWCSGRSIPEPFPYLWIPAKKSVRGIVTGFFIPRFFEVILEGKEKIAFRYASCYLSFARTIWFLPPQPDFKASEPSEAFFCPGKPGRARDRLPRPWSRGRVSPRGGSQRRHHLSSRSGRSSPSSRFPTKTTLRTFASAR